GALLSASTAPASRSLICLTKASACRGLEIRSGDSRLATDDQEVRGVLLVLDRVDEPATEAEPLAQLADVAPDQFGVLAGERAGLDVDQEPEQLVHPPLHARAADDPQLGPQG